MEAKDFVLKKLNECMLFVHEDYPKSIFHIWDKQLIRTKKLLRLSGKNEIDFKPGKNSLYLFEQDYKNGYFRYSYYNIYQILKSEYKINDKEINELIKGILTDDNKMRSLTLKFNTVFISFELADDNKMRSLTPTLGGSSVTGGLADDNKMKSLIPKIARQHNF